MVLGPSLGPKMRTSNKQLITKSMEATVFVCRLVTEHFKHTGTVINNRPNNGIFLGDLSRKLVVLVTRLLKLSVGLLKLSLDLVILSFTFGQLFPVVIHSGVTYFLPFAESQMEFAQLLMTIEPR